MFMVIISRIEIATHDGIKYKSSGVHWRHATYVLLRRLYRSCACSSRMLASWCSLFLISLRNYKAHGHNCVVLCCVCLDLYRHLVLCSLGWRARKWLCVCVCLCIFLHNFLLHRNDWQNYCCCWWCSSGDLFSSLMLWCNIILINLWECRLVCVTFHLACYVISWRHNSHSDIMLNNIMLGEE